MPTTELNSLKALGLNDRYVYWQGKSGEKYIFTKIHAHEIPLFRNCILLTANTQPEPQLLSVAMIEDATTHRQPSSEDAQYYVHLLASGDHCETILQDLTNSSGTISSRVA